MGREPNIAEMAGVTHKTICRSKTFFSQNVLRLRGPDIEEAQSNNSNSAKGNLSISVELFRNCYENNKN